LATRFCGPCCGAIIAVGCCSSRFIEFLVYLLVRHHTESGTSTGRRNTAEDLLAERLARGEIDEDEYRRRRDALRR